MVVAHHRAIKGALAAASAALVGCAVLSSPAHTPRTGELVALTFHGPGFHPVEMDGYGLARGPHFPVRAELPLVSPDLPRYYLENGAPIAYLRGSRVEATLEAAVPEDWSGDVAVHGVGEGWRLDGAGIAEHGRLRATVRASEPLPDAIDLVERFTIDWTAEHRGNRLAIGRSANSLYVLRAPPTSPLVHTPLHIAATNARGVQDEDSIVARIWHEFTDREVRRVRDGRVLRYYGEWNDKAPAELRRMLVGGTGQCVAWSYLLYAALGSQGIESEIISIVPPDRGRVFVGNWRFIEGRRFIDTGPNGVAESVAEGDDVVILPPGTGVPHSRIWIAPQVSAPPLQGDDEGLYRVGPNGLADTRVDSALALTIIPYGFGLESQRAYQLEPDTDPASIRLGGDDVIAQHINTRYVLTGPNGILETERQPGFRQGRATGALWDPRPGAGSTTIRVEFALPRGAPAPEPAGDDRAWGWWIDSGPGGVSQTSGANQGKGRPYAVAIEAGPNGIIDTRPGGDDRVVDLSEFLDLAPDGFVYVNGRNMWPLPGTLGQDNPNPPPDYPNHVIVKARGNYYDPSYGTGPFPTQLDWERASLAAIGRRIQRDGKNVEFDGRIVMVAQRADGSRTFTSFIRMLSPD